MKKYWPFLLILGILFVGIGWGQLSCATVRPEQVSTGVVRTGPNQELGAAVIAARRKLPDFIARYQHPQPGDKAFGVLARFPSPQGPIRAWVHVQKYANNSFSGTLDSDVATTPTKSKRDRVSVPQEDVDDWIYLADGKQVGGLTMQVLQRQSGLHE